jgi:hypothetical protein
VTVKSCPVEGIRRHVNIGDSSGFDWYKEKPVAEVVCGTSWRETNVKGKRKTATAEGRRVEVRDWMQSKWQTGSGTPRPLFCLPPAPNILELSILYLGNLLGRGGNS